MTALFADLSGFTALAQRLDPDELTMVVDPVLGELTGILIDYGGRVEKFAGDAILALFGAPVTREDDAARALHAALDLHAALAGRGAVGEASLSLHVGVSTGTGIAREVGTPASHEYAVIGEFVVLAQRLESLAPAGQTYVGEVTARLAGDRFRFAPLGRLRVKGRSEPVRARRLLGRRPGKVPAPRRAREPILGRSAELSTIEAMLDAAVGGDGGVVTLTGDPGVGKTRLLAEVRRGSTRLGLRWLDAQCEVLTAGIAYGPLRALTVRETAQRVPRKVFASHDEDSGLEPLARRRSVNAAVASWLAAVPTVLAVEDLQWADSATLNLIEHLSATCRTSALLLVLTGRKLPPLDLGSAGDRRRDLHLRPLHTHEVHLLARTVLGERIDAVAGSALAVRSGGNPFFARELVQAMRTSGDLAWMAGSWRLRDRSTSMPESISGLLAASLDTLPPDASPALAVAAVIGNRVSIPLASAVLADPRGLEPLLDAGVLSAASSTECTFRHALLHEAAYARLVRRDRQLVHGRVAAAVTLMPASEERTALLAEHLFSAGALAEALPHLLAMAARARNLHANEEAAAVLERAVEAAVATESATKQLAHIYAELADVRDLQGQYDDALQAWDRAVLAGGGVRAWAGRAGTLRKMGRYEEGLRGLDSAAVYALTGDLRPLWLERSWLLAVLGRRREALAAAEAGLGSAVGLVDRLSGRLLLQVVHIQTLEGRLSEAEESVAAAIEALTSASDDRGLAQALREQGHLLLRRGQPAAAQAALERGLLVARRVGAVDEAGGCLVNLGLVVSACGDHEAALGRYREAVEQFTAAGHRPGVAIATGNGAWELMQLGELSEGERWARRSQREADAIGNTLVAADATLTLSLIAERRGRLAAAVAEAEEAARRFTKAGAGAEADDARSRARLLRRRGRRG